MKVERAVEVLRDIEVDALETARTALVLRTALEIDPSALEGPRLARRIARLEADGESHRDVVVMVAKAVEPEIWWRRLLRRALTIS